MNVIVGANGAGKTNLLEAIGYLATLRSLRGSVMTPWSERVKLPPWSEARPRQGLDCLIELEISAYYDVTGCLSTSAARIRFPTSSARFVR